LDTVAGSSACSVGRNTLTSPLLGLSVPIIATRASAQNSVNTANPTPVANISTDTSCSNFRRG
jgi:hypothetical protein